VHDDPPTASPQGEVTDISSSERSARPPTDRFQPPNTLDVDSLTNLQWNRERWGQRIGWERHDQFGYRWGGGLQQGVGTIAAFADRFFRPHTRGRYDLDILELSPGAGRFTCEIIRYAASLVLVDMSSSAIDLCRQRFQYFPTPIEFFVNDGASLEMMSDRAFDSIVCYDWDCISVLTRRA
jgi:2-polyprenyl-3-methyl-5-hydroxy-6-metoxy-1,4-benzoquinol methylase